MLLDAQNAADEALILTSQSADGTPALQTEVFNELHRRHELRVKLFLAKKIGTSELAEDIAQAVWMAVWRSLPTMRLEGRFVSWLLGVADNIRKKHQKESFSSEKCLIDVEPVDPKAERELACRLRIEELKHLLRKCLQRLGEQVKMIIRRRLRGVPHDAIAEELGLTSGHVRNMFSASRLQLETCFEKNGEL